jgi:hypothetical protein
MNYNYILFTGDSTISGSITNFLNNNNLAYSLQQYSQESYIILDENGKEKENPLYFDDSIITGSHCSLASLNSQTLLEGGFSITVGSNKYYYTINDSGNYAIDVENSNGNIILDPSLTLDSEDIVFYDKRDSATGVSIHSPLPALDVDGLRSKVHTAYSNAGTEDALFENYDVFLNGQKLKYSEQPAYGTTGHLFAIPKKDKINEAFSDEPDLFGSGFVEHHVDFYLNGMEQDPQDFLQIYTGVYMIETGINSSFTLINEELETYVL